MTDTKPTVTRESLRSDLEDATRRMKEAKGDKKRDAKLHRENIGSIQTEIDEIMGQLDEMK